MDGRTPAESTTQHLATEDAPTQHTDFEDLPTQHAGFEDRPTSTVTPAGPDPVTEILTRPAKRTRTKVLVAVIAAGLVAGMLLAAAVREGGRPAEEPRPPAATKPADAVNERPAADDASSASTAEPAPATESSGAPASSSSSGSSSGLQFQDRPSGTEVDRPSGADDGRPSTPSRSRSGGGADRSEMEDRIDRRF